MELSMLNYYFFRVSALLWNLKFFKNLFIYIPNWILWRCHHSLNLVSLVIMCDEILYSRLWIFIWLINVYVIIRIAVDVIYGQELSTNFLLELVIFHFWLFIFFFDLFFIFFKFIVHLFTSDLLCFICIFSIIFLICACPFYWVFWCIHYIFDGFYLWRSIFLIQNVNSIIFYYTTSAIIILFFSLAILN
jgi:hypothetical protein